MRLRMYQSMRASSCQGDKSRIQYSTVSTTYHSQNPVAQCWAVNCLFRGWIQHSLHNVVTFASTIDRWVQTMFKLDNSAKSGAVCPEANTCDSCVFHVEGISLPRAQPTHACSTGDAEAMYYHEQGPDGTVKVVHREVLYLLYCVTCDCSTRRTIGLLPLPRKAPPGTNP